MLRHLLAQWNVVYRVSCRDSQEPQAPQLSPHCKYSRWVKDRRQNNAETIKESKHFDNETRKETVSNNCNRMYIPWSLPPFMYLISEMEKYVWNAMEKLKGLQLIFRIRDINVRFPSAAKQTFNLNSKLLGWKKGLLSTKLRRYWSS